MNMLHVPIGVDLHCKLNVVARAVEESAPVFVNLYFFK
jgi:hypothetical protein